MANGGEMEGLYLNAEKEDGYIRDQSVFGHNISIEDTMSVMVKYNNKAVMTYSLNAFCPGKVIELPLTVPKDGWKWIL
jgi:hypothetical protein